MGSRAWGAERRFPDDVSEMRVYDRSGEAESLLPPAVAKKAEELGWDEIWQLTYCQWCAGYAHDSEPWMTNKYWDDPELGDARQVWGPSARSIFSIVDKDEAAWVVDNDYKYPVIGLYETRLGGWWAYGFGREGFQTIDLPHAWSFDRENPVGANDNMTPSEKTRVDAFWRSRSEDLKIMLKLNSCVIQIPFLTRGAFAQFRDAMYAEEDKPMETDKFAEALTDVQYAGPLYQFWKKIVIDDDYTWPPDLKSSFVIAYTEQVMEIHRVLSEAYREIFDDDMPVSPSSPIQPQEFIDNPLGSDTNIVLNRRGYPIAGASVEVVFDIMAPLVYGEGTIELDEKGDAILRDRS